MNDGSKCGSNIGYRRHKRADEDVCPPCSAAHVRYEKGRVLDVLQGNARKVSPVGTQRRIQALVALGWTYPQIGEQLGIVASGVGKINRYTSVRRDLADRVAAVYDVMSMSLPPAVTRVERRNVGYARTIARRHGWAPPLAWDDIDNDAAPAGVRVRELRSRHDVDTWEDFDELAAEGYTRQQIADRLGMSKQALEKALARRQNGAA